MGLILLEALAALLLFVLIIWWTMFSGRQGGEPPREPELEPNSGSQVDTDATSATSPRPGAGLPRE